MTYTEASEALKQGKRVRLPNWPDGQYLKQLESDDVSVFRDFQLSSPRHATESWVLDREDWEVYELLEGITELDHVSCLPVGTLEKLVSEAKVLGVAAGISTNELFGIDLPSGEARWRREATASYHRGLKEELFRMAELFYGEDAKAIAGNTYVLAYFKGRRQSAP